MIIAISEYGICSLKIVSVLCSNITQLTIVKLGPKHRTLDFQRMFCYSIPQLLANKKTGCTDTDHETSSGPWSPLTLIPPTVKLKGQDGWVLLVSCMPFPDRLAPLWASPGTSCPSWAGGRRWGELSSSWPIEEAGMGWLSYKRLKSSCLIDYEF